MPECGGLPGSPELQGLVGFELNGGEGGVGFDLYQNFIENILEKEPEIWVTVVIPEILPAHWWQSLLHNQRALLLKTALLFKERVILTDVPFHLKR